MSEVTNVAAIFGEDVFNDKDRTDGFLHNLPCGVIASCLKLYFGEKCCRM